MVALLCDPVPGLYLKKPMETSHLKVALLSVVGPLFKGFNSEFSEYLA
jgi:hypothetical protein